MSDTRDIAPPETLDDYFRDLEPRTDTSRMMPDDETAAKIVAEHCAALSERDRVALASAISAAITEASERAWDNAMCSPS